MAAQLQILRNGNPAQRALLKAFELYLAEYGDEYDRGTFVQFVIAQLVNPKGNGAHAVVEYHLKQAIKLNRQLGRV